MLNVKYAEFYKYDEMVSFLEEAQASYSGLIKVSSLVKTPEGRDVLLAEITDSSTGTAESKSAYYIQANVHAQEGAGTTSALHVIRTLLTDERCSEILKRMTFYIIPRLNPDGTEYSITTRGEIRSRNRYIKRKNGLVHKDINGDGLITTMRWKDPTGPMKEDEVDPRIMVKREDGDTEGPFYQVVSEGIIEDYDGTNIVDAIRGIDFNRIWPVNWKPGMGGADYPLQEPEIKAAADFLIAHPNIFAGVDIHCGNNGILRPTMRPDSELNPDDLELIMNIGKKAEAATGFPLIHETDYKESWRMPIMLNGNSNDWSYFALGISHYVVELGNGFNNCGILTREYLNADWRTRETVLMRKVMAYHDEHGSQLFVPWEKFEHPQLGEVEIGGILKGNGYFMYPPAMEAVYPGVTDFVLQHAAMHPELAISPVKAVKAGAGVYRISTKIANVGGLSTNVMKGGSPYYKTPVSVELVAPAGVEVLSGRRYLEIGELGPRGSASFAEWLIKASQPCTVTISACHPKAGSAKFDVNIDF